MEKFESAFRMEMTAKITLKEISRLANVSIATVSRVVNGHQGVSPKIRQRVERVIQETGYQPNPAARSLAGRKTRIIGLVIPEPTVNLFADPYYALLIPSISETCKSHDYILSLFLFPSIEEEVKVITRVLSRQLLDGIILTGTRFDDPAVTQLLHSDTPFVMIGSHEHPAVSYVDSDNMVGAMMGVVHLLGLGYRRVASITGPQTNLAAVQRQEGYRQALQQYGHSYNPNLVIESDFTEAGGYDSMMTLLHQSPDAVFVASDKMAEGALAALQHSDIRVPEQIAVVGFDDLPTSSYTTPPLTTVRQPIRRSGSLAVKTLIQQLEGHNEPRRLLLSTELIVRDSCGQHRKKKEVAI